jgi:hypothetical protein
VRFVTDQNLRQSGALLFVPIDMDLSASCLCYLFADQAVGAMTRRQRLNGDYGVETPTTGVLVHLGLLEREMLAIAVWNLDVAGAVSVCETEPDTTASGARCATPSTCGSTRSGGATFSPD